MREMQTVVINEMTAVSVRQSVCHAAQLDGACSMCGAFAGLFGLLFHPVTFYDIVYHVALVYVIT